MDAHSRYTERKRARPSIVAAINGWVMGWVTAHTWALDAMRGVASLALGLSWLLVWRVGEILALVGLGLYLLFDGCFDLVSSWNARHKRAEKTHVLTSFQSIAIGLGLLVLQNLALALIVLYVGLRTALRGLTDMWRSMSSLSRHGPPPRGGERFPWLVGIGLLVLVLATAVLSPLVSVIVVLYLAMYFTCDGIVFLYSAVLKSGLIRRHSDTGNSTIAPPDALVPTSDPRAPGALRAVAFVRRTGASGMGHVGWAFEWPRGWFSAGSVENQTNAAFTSPELAGSWLAHTQDPVATMQKHAGGYDEFKVFSVSDPHPKEALRAAFWVSRQPYSVRRRNCSDAAYDVLRAYHATPLHATSQKAFPNEWYDALPGPSYRIVEHPSVPVRPERAARMARLPIREIELHLPPHIAVASPLWRSHGGQAWDELKKRLEYINEESLAAIGAMFRFLVLALRRMAAQRARIVLLPSRPRPR